MRTLLRQLTRVGVTGAALGGATFLLESGLMVRTGAVGLKVDTQGPFAAVFAAIRPALPELLGKVAAVYLLAGACVALVAWGLSRWAGLSFRGAPWLVGGLGCLLLVWDRAIARPALFDDLPFVRPLLQTLVNAGRPSHPRLVASVGVGVLVVLALRRPSSRRLLLGGAVAGVTLVPAPKLDPPRLVVLYGIDAFRPDRLKANGASGEVAPNLDQFIGEATLFDQAYTPIAQTEPAWRSLLTARWPTATGVRYPLTADERVRPLPTFPASMEAAGYRTVFQTDCSRFNWLGESSGFSVRREPPRGALNFALEKLRYRALGVFADNALGAWWLPEFIENRALAGIYEPVGYAERLAARVVNDAARGPLFFAFHATAAHFPGDPVYPHYRRFVSASQPLERRLRMVFSPISGPKGSSAGWGADEAEALYDELLAEADAQFGVFVAALKKAGLYDAATIVVFSDHGESFHRDVPDLGGATPVHGARISEEENRILLAVKLPGRLPGPKRVAALTRLIDIGPTLLEAAGARAIPEADGVSLLPLLKGEPLAPLRLYAETGFTHASPEVFDAGHAPGAPRTFEAYQVRADGVLQMGPASHAALLAEKDHAAFDGRSWWTRSPRRSGGWREECRGPCDDPDLKRWFDAVRTSEVEP